MPQVSLTSLTRFVLTEEESVTGHILTSLNLAVIQNLIADASESKINLEYNPLNPVKFAQDEAFLSGQLKTLRYLQEMHEESQHRHLQIVSGSQQ